MHNDALALVEYRSTYIYLQLKL